MMLMIVVHEMPFKKMPFKKYLTRNGSNTNTQTLSFKTKIKTSLTRWQCSLNVFATRSVATARSCWGDLYRFTDFSFPLTQCLPISPSPSLSLARSKTADYSTNTNKRRETTDRCTTLQLINKQKQYSYDIHRVRYGVFQSSKQKRSQMPTHDLQKCKDYTR